MRADVSRLNRISTLAAAVARAEPKLTRLREQLHAEIRAAHEEGVSVTSLAKLSGLSRQRIDTITKRKG